MSAPESPRAHPLSDFIARPAGAASVAGWLVLLLIPLAILITAISLTPSPLGHGTHTQLGLPPCGFLTLTTLPCPGCGLTTCFAFMVRLDFVHAARANAFGIPLFLTMCACIPLSIWGLVKRRRVWDTLEMLRFERVVIALAITSTLVWVTRVIAILVHRA